MAAVDAMQAIKCILDVNERRGASGAAALYWRHERHSNTGMRRDVPGQEEPRKWFRSHLLGREVELQELYDLSLSELDLLMAETAEIRSDPENRARNHGRWCTAGYMLELARIIDARRMND